MNLKQFAGYHVSNLIYGANDGIVTTFAVVSGASGAGFSSKVIIVLGFANLIADGFSMGASRYLSLKSEQNYTGTLDHPTSREPIIDGLVTFFAFILAGFLPLVPFIFGIAPENQFLVSAIATGMAFFLVGSAQALIMKRNAFIAGFEMFFVGGTASAIAYLIGRIIADIVK